MYPDLTIDKQKNYHFDKLGFRICHFVKLSMKLSVRVTMIFDTSSAKPRNVWDTLLHGAVTEISCAYYTAVCCPLSSENC
jgi:hypothetical protein